MLESRVQSGRNEKLSPSGKSKSNRRSLQGTLNGSDTFGSFQQLGREIPKADEDISNPPWDHYKGRLPVVIPIQLLMDTESGYCHLSLETLQVSATIQPSIAEFQEFAYALSTYSLK